MPRKCRYCWREARVEPHGALDEGDRGQRIAEIDLDDGRACRSAKGVVRIERERGLRFRPWPARGPSSTSQRRPATKRAYGIGRAFLDGQSPNSAAATSSDVGRRRSSDCESRGCGPWRGRHRAPRSRDRARSRGSAARRPDRTISRSFLVGRTAARGPAGTGRGPRRWWSAPRRCARLLGRGERHLEGVDDARG